MADYAKDVLVDTDWVEEHLDDDSIRIVEVDENPALYAEAHIPGAIGFDWKTRPAGPGQARLPRPGGLRRALRLARDLQRPHDRPLRRSQQLVRRLHVLVPQVLRPRRRQAHQRPAREVDRRGPPDDRPTSRYEPATFTAQPGDDAIRAKRDEVLAALDGGDPPRRRPLAAGVLRRAHRHGRLRAGGRPARRPHPGRGVGAVGAGGHRGRHLQVRRRPRASSTAARACSPATPIIAYCRIGERSAHTWFVLHELLGEDDVKNYDGSWTEWGNLVDVPIEKGERLGASSRSSRSPDDPRGRAPDQRARRRRRRRCGTGRRGAAGAAARSRRAGRAARSSSTSATSAAGGHHASPGSIRPDERIDGVVGGDGGRRLAARRRARRASAGRPISSSRLAQRGRAQVGVARRPGGRRGRRSRPRGGAGRRGGA